MEHVGIEKIINPWQAIVIIVIIVAPQILVWLSSRSTKRLLQHEASANSGTTLKDSLNRIEVITIGLSVKVAENADSIAKVSDRLGIVEKSIRPQFTRRWRGFGDK